MAGKLDSPSYVYVTYVPLSGTYLFVTDKCNCNAMLMACNVWSKILQNNCADDDFANSLSFGSTPGPNIFAAMMLTLDLTD